MTDRSRVRVGRGVFYNPTAAEIAAYGVGPWAATIVKVNTGSVDLQVWLPVLAEGAEAPLDEPLIEAADPAEIAAAAPTAVAAAALASPLIAAADIAAFTDPPSAAEMALLRTFVNEVKTDLNVAATLINQIRASIAEHLTLITELRTTLIAERVLGLELKEDVNELGVLANAEEIGSRRNEVPEGGGYGTYSLGAGSAAV